MVTLHIHVNSSRSRSANIRTLPYQQFTALLWDWVFINFTWTVLSIAILGLTAFSLTIWSPVSRCRISARSSPGLGSSSTSSWALWPINKLSPFTVNWIVVIVIHSAILDNFVTLSLCHHVIQWNWSLNNQDSWARLWKYKNNIRIRADRIWCVTTEHLGYRWQFVTLQR